MKVTEAIKMAKKGANLEGIIIENLEKASIKIVDVLLLAKHGLTVPEYTICYEDTPAYDEDFDEIEWS